MKQTSNEYFGKDLEAMSFAQNYHQWILEICSPYLGKVVAEIGAGTGNFSDFLLKGTMKSSGVVTYDRLVVPFMKRVERILPLPIGKNLVLVARKK